MKKTNDKLILEVSWSNDQLPPVTDVEIGLLATLIERLLAEEQMRECHLESAGAAHDLHAKHPTITES